MIIQSKKVWFADQFVEAQIEVKDGKIVDIYEYGTHPVDCDYGDNRILPGFIDVHCHGAYGFDTNDAKEDGLRYWVRNIVDEGVTALLATTITQSEEVLTNALKNVAKVVEDGYEGAEILGVHFEGPYLDMKYKGAQPEQYIVKPTVEQFKKYQEAANGLIKYITMATETDDDFALTRYCAENGVVVSIGHSAATSKEAVQAFAHGARSMTHVYNGMTPFNHRANGLVGAAYRMKSMYGEIICDGNHSTPLALHQFFEAKGPHYGIMVSDALMAKGSPGGTILMAAHEQLEELVLDRATYEVKKDLGNKFAQIVYEGKWFTPLREAIQAFIDVTQQYVTGEVKFKLYKGNIIKAGETSPYSLYSESLASFTTGELYDHHDAEGFINLFGLPLKVRAMKMQELEK